MNYSNIKNNSPNLQKDKIWLQYYIKIGIILCIFFSLLIIILFTKTNKILLLNDKMIFSLILVLTIISMIQVNNYISCAKNETNEKRILEHNTNNITTTAEVLDDNSPEFIKDKGLYYLKYDSKYLRNKPGSDGDTLVFDIDKDKQQYAGIYKFFKLYACSNNDNQIETNCWVFCSQFSNKWINSEGGLIKAENKYVNDTSKFSIIDDGTTGDNYQVQLKSINNDKYLSIDDNKNLVYNIDSSNNNENNAITIEFEEVEGSPYKIRTTQDLKDVIDTSKQVFMYSAYYNNWLRHKFNSNQYVRVDVNNITDATPMVIIRRDSDGDYDESVYMYRTVHIKKLYVENYNEWWSDRCGNGCASWNAIECQPEHLIDQGDWAKSYERFKIRPNTEGDDVCYTPDFIDDSRVGNSRQKCEFTWNITGSIDRWDHNCGYANEWGGAMFCRLQIKKDESQLMFYTLEVVSDVVYEDGSYAITYIDQERDCSTTNENSFIDTNKCYSISNGDKYCNYVYEFENSDSNNDNTNDISDNSGYLLCSDDTITSVFSFVSTDDDNVFLLKPKSVYDTNDKYCYVDTVSDKNNIKCVSSASDKDNTNNMNDNNNNNNNNNNVNSNIVTFNIDDLKSKNIYNFNLINLNDSTTTTTASVNSNTTTSTTSNNSNNSNNDDDPNCYRNTYLVNKKGNTYCYSNPLDKKIYCDLNEENNNTSDKFFTNFKIEIQNCNTYDGRLDLNSIKNHISFKNKYFKIKSVKTDKWLQNNMYGRMQMPWGVNNKTTYWFNVTCDADDMSDASIYELTYDEDNDYFKIISNEKLGTKIVNLNWDMTKNPTGMNYIPSSTPSDFLPNIKENLIQLKDVEDNEYGYRTEGYPNQIKLYNNGNFSINMKINTSVRKDDEVSYSTCGVLGSESDNENMISAERGVFSMKPDEKESQFLFYVSDEIPEE